MLLTSPPLLLHPLPPHFDFSFLSSHTKRIPPFLAFIQYPRPTSVILVEEEETLVPEQESPSPAVTTDQTVSVAVSPSDILTMFFPAEGAMADSAIPTVTKALEVVEGITDLKVQVIEGIVSVELTKQTTVRATGMASNLVEIIQGSGLKLQTLNLSFQDEEDFN